MLRSWTASGYKAIFLSVDTPLLGRRLNEYRNNFCLPDGIEWPNLLSDGKSELSGNEKDGQSSNRHDFGTSLSICILIEYMTEEEIVDPSLDWDSAIPWLKKHTKLQLWLKGGKLM